MATVFTNFWQETGTKVARHQKRRLQSWFADHPGTFLLAWGTKALAWNVPKFAITGSRAALNKWRGKAKTKKPRVRLATASPVVSSLVAPTWSVRPPRRVTPVRLPGGGLVIDLTVPAHTPAAIAVPIPRRETLEAGRTNLKTSHLGRAFLALSSQFDAFVPVRGAEAYSTLKLLADAQLGMRGVANATDVFAEVVFECGLNRQVTTRLWRAVESVEDMAAAFSRAKRTTENLYAGQLEQDESGAQTVQTLPVRVASVDLAEGIVPACAAIAGTFGQFIPTVDAEATSILEQIRMGQAGWALVAAALEELVGALRLHRVDPQVTNRVRVAGNEASAAATAFRDARRAMLAIYQGQMAQEQSGTPTIRTIPTRPAA